MKKVNITLLKKGRTHGIVGLTLYDYEGTEGLKKLVVVIEDTLKKNFPGVQINRDKGVKALFKEGE